MSNKYDFYLAGPFFNDRQQRCQDRIEEMMDYYGKKVFSPRKDAGKLGDNTTKAQMKEVFDADLNAIDNCNILFANVSSKDTGTSVEIGYALAKNIPVIIYYDPQFAETDHVNLMIALACGGIVLENQDELEAYLRGGVLPIKDKFNFLVD